MQDPAALAALPEDGLFLDRFSREGKGFVVCWRPQGVSVVLGRGTPLTDVHLEHCTADGVPVFRRRGGGGAVVLSSGVQVISACVPRNEGEFPTAWLHRLSGAVAEALRSLGARAVSVQGHGDVCLGDLKVLGASLYAAARAVLYQASLLVDNDIGLFDTYLPMPAKAPAYRRGRPHGQFVTTLRAAGYQWPAAELTRALQHHVEAACALQRKD